MIDKKIVFRFMGPLSNRILELGLSFAKLSPSFILHILLVFLCGFLPAKFSIDVELPSGNIELAPFEIQERKRHFWSNS